MSNITRNTLLDTSIFEPIQGGTLFYPCSGDDWAKPLEIFGPYCSDFWFVDINYFRDQPPERENLILSRQQGYELLDVQIRFPNIPVQDWSTDEKYGCQPPPIRTETYKTLKSGRIVQVHRHRRRGPSALRTQIDRFGVFFYRGDSEGEGGSGTEWLTSRHQHGLIHEVLEKLIDGGLIVTDGSNCHGDHNPYRELRRLRYDKTVTAEQAIASASAFHDDVGRSFRCIGCLGQHCYGPTMVWQVHRPSANVCTHATITPS